MNLYDLGFGLFLVLIIWTAVYYGFRDKKMCLGECFEIRSPDYEFRDADGNLILLRFCRRRGIATFNGTLQKLDDLGYPRLDAKKMEELRRKFSFQEKFSMVGETSTPSKTKSLERESVFCILQYVPQHNMHQLSPYKPPFWMPRKLWFAVAKIDQSALPTKFSRPSKVPAVAQ